MLLYVFFALVELHEFDPIIWRDLETNHGFVYDAWDFVRCVVVARVNQQVKQVCFQIESELRLQFLQYLAQLIEPENVFLLVLDP